MERRRLLFESFTPVKSKFAFANSKDLSDPEDILAYLHEAVADRWGGDDDSCDTDAVVVDDDAAFFFPTTSHAHVTQMRGPYGEDIGDRRNVHSHTSVIHSFDVKPTLSTLKCML